MTSTTVPLDTEESEASATIRAVSLFLDSRNEQHAAWNENHPKWAFPGAAVRPSVEPARCSICQFDLFDVAEHGECEYGAWRRAMEAAGLPLRPYRGHKRLIVQERYLAGLRAAYEAQQQEVIRQRDLLYERYRTDRDGEFRHPVHNRPRSIPRKVEDAFWEAVRQNRVSGFFADLDAEAAVSEKVEQAVSAKVLEGVSDNLVFPEGRVAGTRAARAKAKKPRAKIRRDPAQVLHDHRARSDLGERIYAYFTKIGHPIITRHHEETGTRMIVDDLADVLFDKIMSSAISRQIAEDGTPGRGVVTHSDLHREAVSAARFLLAEWSATYRAEAAERGRRGGLRSKRPEVFTVEMLREVRAAHPGVVCRKWTRRICSGAAPRPSGGSAVRCRSRTPCIRDRDARHRRRLRRLRRHRGNRLARAGAPGGAS